LRGSDAALDLSRAALAVARIEYPDLDEARELERLDALATRIGPARRGESAAALDRLRRFLFEEEGFKGNADAYYDPRNSCLNDVIARKLGIPITLSVLTIEVGRRVGLAISGVGLPGHFIVSAAAEVAARAVGRPVKLEEAHWTPTTKRQIVVRMLRNLKTIYARQSDWGRALCVIDRLLLVDAETPMHVRDRGTVLVKAGRLWEGAVEWERYLGAHASAPDAEAFRQELRRVRQELGSRN
jgi:regulator of sirC expression with transglutaminase-like and TPR domain